MATMPLDARAFDNLVSQTRRLEESLPLPPRRTLTPARILVLAILCVSPSRKAIRDTARAFRSVSRFAAHIHRVPVHSRLGEILRDLEDMGLVHCRRCDHGPHSYALEAGVHRCMQACLRDASNDAARATSP